MTDQSHGSNVIQLKGDIDAGRTGDKIAGFDPAAAPLGADDEAAGAPAEPQAVGQARTAERPGESARRNGAEPDLAPDARMRRDGPFAAVAVGTAAGVAVGLVLLAALA